ncbi:MAG TPA: hypothetical protein ENN80_01455, partial [Candidatus Hydrogenedentes bacterium]|nr:hypothetical protein [Candidatus Hydrogenedentota bacterium]
MRRGKRGRCGPGGPGGRGGQRRRTWRGRSPHHGTFVALRRPDRQRRRESSSARTALAVSRNKGVGRVGCAKLGVQPIGGSMLTRLLPQEPELAHDVFWRTVQVLGKQGATLLCFLVVARLLTPYDFGIYNYLFSTVCLLMLFSDFGVSFATTRFAAEYALADRESLRRLVAGSGAILVLCSAAVVVALAAAGPWLFREHYRDMLKAAPLVLLLPLAFVFEGAYRGLRRFRDIALIVCAVGVVAIPLTYVLTSKRGLGGAIIALALHHLLMAGALALNWRDTTYRPEWAVIRRVARYAALIGAANIGYFFYT